MKELSFTYVDREGWPAGVWDSEPDKMQWPDAATGLPCLAVRTDLGHWCGYVGVSPGHPLYEKDYDKAAEVDVHGGLTFADRCTVNDRARFDLIRWKLDRAKEEAKRYPDGDSARFVRAWGDVLDDYDAWYARIKDRGICHVPDEDEPDKVWWFGFDCAHSGDTSPGMMRVHKLIGMEPPLSVRYGNAIAEYHETYKDLAYVRAECSRLAAQLAELA